VRRVGHLPRSLIDVAGKVRLPLRPQYR